MKEVLWSTSGNQFHDLFVTTALKHTKTVGTCSKKTDKENEEKITRKVSICHRFSLLFAALNPLQEDAAFRYRQLMQAFLATADSRLLQYLDVADYPASNKLP